LEKSTAQYLTALDAADRQESMNRSGSPGFGKLRDKLVRLKSADAEAEGPGDRNRGVARQASR
jgi:hypothetical protein